MKKIIKYLSIVIITILVIMLLIFFINNKNSITEKMPVRILIIKSNSMYPILKIKDIIIIKKSNTYNVNDIITYNTENEVLITHRIVKSCEGGFITKGDNNNTEDLQKINFEEIEGKLVLVIPKLGKILSALENQIIFLVIILMILIICFFNIQKQEKRDNRREKKKIEEEKRSKN